MGLDTFVIIPTYNEADNLAQLVGEIMALPVPLGVIVVDDNSPDGTGELAERLGEQFPGRVNVIHRPGKLGLGTAYVAGFHRAFESGARRVVTMDADFSHHPRYLPAMVELSRQKDLVIGSRYVRGGGTLRCTLPRRALSWVANSIAHLFLGLKARDTTAGFRLYRREVLDSIPLDTIFSTGYSFLIEMLFLVQRAGWSVGEVPIVFEDRRAGTTKISHKEVYKAMYTVARLCYRQLRTFFFPRPSPAPRL